MRNAAKQESEHRFAKLPSGQTICFRTFGREFDPALLLIAGLGEDINAWGSDFVEAIVAQGFRVITMDNRDVGQSGFVSTPPPSTWRQVLARPRADAYTLSDMAGDVVGVLDQLEIARVHLAGRSMGGMIAQTVAALHSHRVVSLTSIYSTTGAKKVGQPALSTIALLCAAPPRNREAAVRAHLRITRHVAGTKYPVNDLTEANIAARAWDRCAGDAARGAGRQIQAIQASGDRTPEVERISVPTLVINGDRDRLVAPSGGAATARAIPNARHVVIPGMGHHIPAALVTTITDQIAQHALDAEKGGKDA